ncbi:sugar-binding transcriptional regulator [Mobiluncus sp.]|uniref:sugar-binding transcriptional regulator n=1 Tax=Mobiluncus sp. TaxID=47293 RepID=UPI002A91D027|nr:sugar-binding domain-containing protein [Mobiluncus sp.]MDY6077110.1 sugar-binding domain-containing protein [Mobiluncus sp.]
MEEREEREETAYRAALMHYVQGETMEAIARKLKVSRSTVSRLIKDARNRGYIQFSLQPPNSATSALRTELSKRFGVQVQVVPIAPRSGGKQRLTQVAAFAGNVIAEAVFPDIVIGVAWGNTISAVAENLVPKPVMGATVVQLNGAANVLSSGILYAGTIMEAFGRAFRASVQHFPVPTFFDFPDTKVALWRERSIQSVLEVQKQVDIAIFGVGTTTGSQLSMVYSGGYIVPEEMQQQKDQGVVGDVCTVLLRADGSWEDLEVNQRASGPTPRDLACIPRRICIVSGVDKAVPLLAALRAGVATDLIVDEDCAARLLKISEEQTNAS